jgi:hypothetical protein
MGVKKIRSAQTFGCSPTLRVQAGITGHQPLERLWS